MNLGSQAESALRQWEQSVLLSDSPSSDISFSTPDFIRATSKLCVPEGPMRNPVTVYFLIFLEHLENPKVLKLSTFHGHRINVLFSMAAAVFDHRKDIEEFIDSYFDDKQNRLVSSVAAYLSNDVFVVGQWVL